MTITVHPDQKVLFAMSPYSPAVALLTVGDIAHEEALGAAGMMDDCLDPQELIKLRPGIYIWEGTIVINDGAGGYPDPDDPDVSWQGAIRPASEGVLLGAFLDHSSFAPTPAAPSPQSQSDVAPQ